MTPLEINKKIALLKGFDPKEPYIKNFCYQDLSNYVSTGEEFSRCFNWSESISDAWELFEEMEQNSIFYNIILNDDYKVWRIGYIDSDGCFDSQSEDNSAPMAICLAYIAWKREYKESANGNDKT